MLNPNVVTGGACICSSVASTGGGSKESPFNKDTTDYWYPLANSTSAYVGLDLEALGRGHCSITSVSFIPRVYNMTNDVKVRIEGSNDLNTWEAISAENTIDVSECTLNSTTLSILSNANYRKYRYVVLHLYGGKLNVTGSYALGIVEAEFYGVTS